MGERPALTLQLNYTFRCSWIKNKYQYRSLLEKKEIAYSIRYTCLSLGWYPIGTWNCANSQQYTIHFYLFCLQLVICSTQIEHYCTVQVGLSSDVPEHWTKLYYIFLGLGQEYFPTMHRPLGTTSSRACDMPPHASLYTGLQLRNHFNVSLQKCYDS